MNKKKFFVSILFSFTIGIIITSICYYILYKNSIKNITAQIKTQNINTSELGNESKLAFNWLEDSGEAEALEFEAFNSATNYLNQISKKTTNKPKAIVLDIDETCLNNAPVEGYYIENNNGNFDYNAWCQWVNYAEATAIPGSVQFTQTAKKDGIQVFYVSGRSQNQLQSTMKNMNNLGFADATEPGHIILYPSTQNGKQPTFDELEKNYDIVMFVGDQLTDMGGQFQNKTNAQEKQLVTQCEKDWGSKYIIIPNPLYGNYVNAISNYKAVHPSEEITDINSGIETFDPKTGKVYYS